VPVAGYLGYCDVLPPALVPSCLTSIQPVWPWIVVLAHLFAPSLSVMVTLVPRGSLASIVLLATIGLSRSCADSELTVNVRSATVWYTPAGAIRGIVHGVAAPAPPIDAIVRAIADETNSVLLMFSLLFRFTSYSLQL
jgi:hypothetical protein